MIVTGFTTIALSPPGVLNHAVPVAAARAGVVGVFNLETVSDVAATLEQLTRAARFVPRGLGVRLGSVQPAEIEKIIALMPKAIGDVILSSRALDASPGLASQLHSARCNAWVEVTQLSEAEKAIERGATGLIAKGNEAGGWVGQETTFVLLQRLLGATNLPVLAFGGVGVHSAAGCYAAGAAGIVLESQLYLARESALPAHVKAVIAEMDGSETIETHGFGGNRFRSHAKGKQRALKLPDMNAGLEWGDIGDWDRFLADAYWPIGQDAAFAAPLAHAFGTVAGIIDGIHAGVRSHIHGAASRRALAPGSTLARSHATEFPVVQGAMTRVSDRAEFARAVADGGALPFLALALMRSDEAAALVEETAAALRGRSWGVGLLGFAPPEIREEQLEVVRTHRPPFALIAGGRPDQAQALEEQGVATYLHVPSPALLKMYLAQGARRFVFEGRECGGHVGPRSSFVLWNQMIDVMLKDLPAREMPSCHLLFAGGVHDARSAAIVAAMSAPLAERGAGTGVLVGTGYLFTEEAVATGAVTASFQRQMLSCAETTLLETGPGHAIRVVPTPYAEEFEQARRDMAEAGKPVNEIRDALESMNMGRLRIASKGRARTNAHGTSETRRLRNVGDEEALQAGMYMAGQVAALRSERTTIHELHLDVSERAEDLVASAARRLPAEARAASRRQPMAVAIIGIECVLPGCADLEAYWQRILEKRSAIVEVPRDRWDWRLFFDADPAARDKIYSKSGGFLEPLPFNPLDFGMPPNSVKSIEPLQLLTLIVARNALRTAGYENRPFDKSRTGVIFGLSGGLGEMASRYIMRSEMPQLFGSVAAELTDASGDILPEWTEDSYAGLLPNVTAGRVANRLDFGGPSYTVDAACASSLAALQAAVNELERGDTDMMLVGGLDNTNNPFTFTAFSKTRALSPTGACHTFDAGADGIAISEGLMMLVLKRLPDAERDGDHIFAVIRGIGSSSDGRARGLTAPQAEGQQLAIRRAYDMAGVSPVTVGLFEAHGTGTVVGDRTEVQALAEFLENAGAAPNSAAIGSVKSVIGHTKAAAGVCGVAKAALALDRKVLPPTAGVVTPNPEAAFGTRPLYVNSEARPWINAGAAHPRRAGVSAFGFGGTNFHAVLEEYDGDGCDDTPAQREWPAELFLFSEKTPAGLYEKLSTWRKRVDEWAEEPLRNLAFTACEESRRSGLAADLRLAIVATGADDLKAKLDSAIRAAAESRPVHDPRGIYLSLAPLTEKGTIAFLFPGQGSQYTNMLAGLAMQFEVVRAALERADEYLFERLPQPLSSYVFPPPVFDENERKAQTAALTDTRVAQPALGAAGTAMLELLSTLGVEPAMTAGHSYGEYVALFAAGAMDERTLLRLSEARGRAIVECATGELGTMAAVGAAPHAVISALDGTADVWIANHNAPEQTVIAGTADGIEAARKSLMAKGVAVKGISVACAFHSPLVAPARDKLLAELSQSELHELQKPAFSNSTGEPYPCGADELRRVLADHLVQPVRFVDEIRAMYDAGARIFVEVGPRSVLTSLARSILEGRDHVAIATDGGAGAQPTAFLHALGQLATQGVPVRTEALFRGREAHMLHTPVERNRSTLPATTWMVTPHVAWPIGSVPEQAPVPPLEDRILDRQSAAGRSRVPDALTLTPGDLGGLARRTVTALHAVEHVEELDAVMLQFQAVMQKALDVQQSVMLAYLGQTSAGAVGRPAVQAYSAVQQELSFESPAHAVGGSERSPAGNGKPAHSGAAVISSTVSMLDRLLRIIGDRTGYPVDMIGLDADLEAELGIDSIKRTEILGALISALFPAGNVSVAMNELSMARTVRSIADLFIAVDKKPNGHAEAPVVETGNVGGVLPPAVRRTKLIAVNEEIGPTPATRLDGLTFLLTDDERRVAEEVAALLNERGADAVILCADDDHAAFNVADFASVTAAVENVRARYGRIAGVIHLLPLRRRKKGSSLSVDEFRARAAKEVKGLFNLLKAARTDFESSSSIGIANIVAAASMGGAWWIADSAGASDAEQSVQGGIAALVKTAAQEWPEVRCRAVDFESAAEPAFIAECVLRELLHPEGDVQVGYLSTARVAIRPAESTEPTSSTRQSDTSAVYQLRPNALVFATGGARGITAEILLALAERNPDLNLVVVGRSVEPTATEAPETLTLDTPTEIKRWLLDSHQNIDEPPDLRAIERRYKAFLADREIRKNLRRLRALCASVKYVQLDVRRAAEIENLIAAMRRDHGTIDLVIHAAGTIDDHLIKDKSPESFDSVFDPKACGAYALVRALDSAPPRSVFFFSSIAGAFGNAGQSDYAAANAVLNSLALYCGSHWQTQVCAIGWGPWDEVGMLSAELRLVVRATGTSLLGVSQGASAFLDELARSPSESQVIVTAVMDSNAAALGSNSDLRPALRHASPEHVLA